MSEDNWLIIFIKFGFYNTKYQTKFQLYIIHRYKDTNVFVKKTKWLLDRNLSILKNMFTQTFSLVLI